MLALISAVTRSCFVPAPTRQSAPLSFPVFGAPRVVDAPTVYFRIADDNAPPVTSCLPSPASAAASASRDLPCLHLIKPNSLHTNTTSTRRAFLASAVISARSVRALDPADVRGLLHARLTCTATPPLSPGPSVATVFHHGACIAGHHGCDQEENGDAGHRGRHQVCLRCLFLRYHINGKSHTRIKRTPVAS